MTQIIEDINEIVNNENLFSPLKYSSVLITGATGLIGSMLIRAISTANSRYSLGMKVFGQIRDLEKTKALFGENFQSVEFVTNPDIKCNYIIHTVSSTSSKFFIEHPVETIRVSVESTMAILEIAKKNNATVVYLSSMEQYGVPYESGQKVTEDIVGIINHLNIRSSYSESKRLCECFCASYADEYSINVMIARLAQTFGAGCPLDDNRMPMQFARAAVEGHDIILHTDGKGIINFVYLTDAITGILTLLKKGERGHAYNICNDKETRTVRSIAELVANNIVGGNIRIIVENHKNDIRYAPENTMYLISEKMLGLGWKAKVGMSEAYSRLIRYIREA